MDITRETIVADLATVHPGTIKVLQQHHIDFCCGGKIPLADACVRQRVDLENNILFPRAVQLARTS